jgi:hypothetical protein
MLERRTVSKNPPRSLIQLVHRNIRMRRARAYRSRRPSDGESASGDVDRGPHPSSPNLSGRLLWNWPAWDADQKWLSATENLKSVTEEQCRRRDVQTRKCPRARRDN